MSKLTVDILQNELLLIDHHLGDIEKAVKSGDNGYALKGLADAKEAVDRLSKFLPTNSVRELKRMEESLTSRQKRLISNCNSNKQ